MENFQDNPPDYFTDESKIPLIVWSNFQQGVLNTLNALLHYYTSLVDDKEFKNVDRMKSKANLYEMKITEGLNYAKFMQQPDDYFKSEISRIQNGFNVTRNKSNGKIKGRRNYRIAKYIVVTILIVILFRACKQWAG